MACCLTLILAARTVAARVIFIHKIFLSTIDQLTPESLCSSGGGALTDPRSIAIVPVAVLETYTIDQGSV